MENCYPFDERYRVTSSFKAHKDRVPPASTPGTDYATPIGKVVRATWSGYCKQENTAEMGGAITASITRNGDSGAPNLGDKIYFVHLSRVEPSNMGKVVKAGDIIGYSGNTGKTTGPHTHIGFKPVWNKKTYADIGPTIDSFKTFAEQQPKPPVVVPDVVKYRVLVTLDKATISTADYDSVADAELAYAREQNIMAEGNKLALQEVNLTKGKTTELKAYVKPITPKPPKFNLFIFLYEILKKFFGKRS